MIPGSFENRNQSLSVELAVLGSAPCTCHGFCSGIPNAACPPLLIVLPIEEIDLFARDPSGLGRNGPDRPVGRFGGDFGAGRFVALRVSRVPSFPKEAQPRVVVPEKGRPVTDADVGRPLKETVEVLLGRNVRGARGLVEDHEARLVVEDPAKGEALLLAQGQHVPPIDDRVQSTDRIPVPGPAREFSQPRLVEDAQEFPVFALRGRFRHGLGGGVRWNIAFAAPEGIQELVPEGPEGAVGLLRQEIDVGGAGPIDGTRPRRPEAGDRTQQRGLSDSGRTDDQEALAPFQFEAQVLDQDPPPWLL
mmetsp:Transcript_25691/g.52719  ORF Transcript_25691/g.52719 Transcript_25691/m.52719 type:complete len:305 (+) Transcript_25691:53-967(+)